MYISFIQHKRTASELKLECFFLGITVSSTTYNLLGTIYTDHSRNTIYHLNSLYCTALLEGICATLNLRIQALKLYIYYNKDIYLQDVILALSWRAEK